MNDAAGALYPVPVRIRNLAANSDSQPSDTSEFQRRFTLTDTIVGKESGSLKFVRFPVMIQIWLRKAVSGDSGKINVPILDIKYLDVSGADLKDISKTIQFSFSSSYIAEFSSERNAIVIVFAVFSSLIFLISLFKTRAWYIRNHQSADIIDIMVLDIDISISFG